MTGSSWFCQACWAEVPSDASSCPRCGRSFQERLSCREALARALPSPEPFTARRAAFLLGRLHDPSSVGALTDAVASGDPHVAAEAVIALGGIGTPRGHAGGSSGRETSMGDGSPNDGPDPARVRGPLTLLLFHSRLESRRSASRRSHETRPPIW